MGEMHIFFRSRGRWVMGACFGKSFFLFSSLLWFILYFWKGVILGGACFLYIFIFVGHQVSIDEGSNSTCLHHERFQK